MSQSTWIVSCPSCVPTCDRCSVGLALVDMLRLKGRYGHYSDYLNKRGQRDRLLVQHPRTGFCPNDDMVGSIAAPEKPS